MITQAAGVDRHYQPVRSCSRQQCNGRSCIWPFGKVADRGQDLGQATRWRTSQPTAFLRVMAAHADHMCWSKIGLEILARTVWLAVGVDCRKGQAGGMRDRGFAATLQLGELKQMLLRAVK